LAALDDMKGQRRENLDAQTLIVYVSPWNWDYFWSRSQPLAKALSAECTVVYVDNWASPRSRAARLLALAGRSSLEKMGDGLFRYHLTHIGPLGVHMPSGNEGERSPRAYRMIRRDLRPLMRRHKEVWLLISRPVTLGYLELAPWDKVIVDIEDPWLSVPWAPRIPEGNVQKLLKRADAVFANGARVAEEYAQIGSRPVHALPNGIEADFVQSVSAAHGKPSRLGDPTGRKRVAFTGQIDERVDLEAVSRMAEARPDFDFIFVGKDNFPDAAHAQQWRDIQAFKNFRYIPRVDRSEIPPILANTDVLLIPYAHIGSVKMFPAKLLEYLSSPAVVLTSVDYSLDLPELQKMPAVRACTTPDAWEQALKEVADGRLRATDEERALRATLLSNNTWESKARQFLSLARL
jgi:glycosyltransferase involved in cell wall biosynthesis